MLPYGRKNPLPFPFSQRSHVGNLRQTIQGKGVIHKRVETAGVYPLNSRFPLFLSLAQIADM